MLIAGMAAILPATTTAVVPCDGVVSSCVNCDTYDTCAWATSSNPNTTTCRVDAGGVKFCEFNEYGTGTSACVACAFVTGSLGGTHGISDDCGGAIGLQICELAAGPSATFEWAVSSTISCDHNTVESLPNGIPSSHPNIALNLPGDGVVAIAMGYCV